MLPLKAVARARARPVRPRLQRDTAAFLEISADLLNAGYAVRFCASGGSMRPAIVDGDTIIVESVDPADVRAGDILLFRQRQRPLAHRVVHIREENHTVVEFILRGDAKVACDAPVRPNEVLGRVSRARGRDRRRFMIRWAAAVRHHIRRNHCLAPRANRSA